MGAVMIACFKGLLRASEALTLKAGDVFDLGSCFVFRLGIAKRGQEQKALVQDPAAVKFLRDFTAWRGPVDDDAGYFGISYNQLQRWLQRSVALLGLDGHWTSHGLRRGGATELVALGTPPSTIALLGRWLSERSLRQYLRLGELALLRTRRDMTPAVRNRIHRLAMGAGCVFDALAG